ncbi:hypothetical protein FB45DRAFT_887598 [Roridomyces roridus]|uniref:Molybdopterin synthase sulfur carrier subunit n=1 Tax=Roridomyces roridus TaxID=1738132 RepID=A0AAD7G237_9AGAR|nr:hypothetical protein FB45DRAFT_887598 [Roridomyces roridus]
MDVQDKVEFCTLLPHPQRLASLRVLPLDIPWLEYEPGFSQAITVPLNLRLSRLGNILVAHHPKATDLRKILESSQWSVDAEMVDDPETVELKGGEEVAIICPVSGG